MRLYYGTYGHHLSGKLYVYWGDDNLRTGEQVVAPVTNKKSGRTYNTMFTIARAQSVKNAQGEEGRLSEQGIFIKTIGGRETLTLPGGQNFDSKAAWKRDSEERYRTKFGLPPRESQNKNPTKSKNALFSLPGGSAPNNRLNSKLKRTANNDSALAARNSILARKSVTIGADKAKAHLRSIRINKRSKEE